MTALAKILIARGANVRGSDTDERFFTDVILEKMGVKTELFSDPLPGDVDGVIYSAAYSKGHPQVELGEQRDIPVLRYTEAIGELSKDSYAIGIAGTHGKTTVTAWLGYALSQAGLDPTVIVGSQVPQFDNSNALAGNDQILVAETCEYRRHFLDFDPDMIAITNIEMDHPDYFSDFDDMVVAYKEYTDKLPKDGVLIKGPEVYLEHTGTTVTYGFPGTDYCLVSRTYAQGRQNIVIHDKNGDSHQLILRMPGAHNALNAVCVFTLGMELQSRYPFDRANFIRGIESFTGTKRRMEYYGENEQMVLYDDYAHHPTEIEVTLETVAEMYENTKVVAIFMPHTFSRTRSLFDDFALSFARADEAIILPVYGSAREEENPETLSIALAEAILEKGTEARYMRTFEEVKTYCKSKKSKAVFITLGAGDNWKIIEDLKNDL